MEIKEAQELLSALPAREQLEALIDYGKQLKEFSETEKKEENKVPGCVSTAYLTVEVKENKVYFSGYSDALTIKGYLAILINGFNGMNVKEFLSTAESIVKEFITKTKLQASLTPSRANTLGNIIAIMIKKVRQQVWN